MNIVTLAHTDTQISLQVVEGATLAQLFGWIETPEAKEFIADYSLDQTTLEQVSVRYYCEAFRGKRGKFLCVCSSKCTYHAGK